MGRIHPRWRASIQSKQRDKYETNEISENIGSGSNVRGSGRHSFRAGDHHDDDNEPCDRHDDYRVGDGHNHRHDCGLHAGFGYIMFRTSTAAAPVRYYYTKDTTILDPEGHTVAWSAIRPDMPATVYYTNVGDRVVVRKVVLSQPATVYEKKETTTTTVKP